MNKATTHLQIGKLKLTGLQISHLSPSTPSLQIQDPLGKHWESLDPSG